MPLTQQGFSYLTTSSYVRTSRPQVFTVRHYALDSGAWVRLHCSSFLPAAITSSISRVPPPSTSGIEELAPFSSSALIFSVRTSISRQKARVIACRGPTHAARTVQTGLLATS